MGVSISDRGILAYEAELDEMLPDDGPHTLTIQNNMPYAQPLHDRLGYYVFNDDHLEGVLDDWLQEMIEEAWTIDVPKALDGVGFEEINFLIGYTGEFKSPVREDQGMRNTHPGGWSDITNNLRQAYTHAVNNRPFKDHTDYDQPT